MENAIKPYVRWYLQNGINYIIGDEPINRYRALQQPSMTSNVASKENNITSALKSHPAFKCHNLIDLRNAIEKFDGCNLRLTSHNLVFSDGNPKSNIMFIGEAPGAEEDMQGLPFVGQSGQLLDKILSCIGLDRTKIYIANIIPWRPPGNRTPTSAEIAMYKPFVEQHIALIDPKILVLLGGVATKAILDTVDGIMKLRGCLFSYRALNGKEIPILPTFHPAYLLRSPRQKELIWQDMLKLKQNI